MFSYARKSGPTNAANALKFTGVRQAKPNFAKRRVDVSGDDNNDFDNLVYHCSPDIDVPAGQEHRFLLCVPEDEKEMDGTTGDGDNSTKTKSSRTTTSMSNKRRCSDERKVQSKGLTTKDSPVVGTNFVKSSNSTVSVTPDFVEVFNDLTKSGIGNAELRRRHEIARQHALGLSTLSIKRASKSKFFFVILILNFKLFSTYFVLLTLMYNRSKYRQQGCASCVG